MEPSLVPHINHGIMDEEEEEELGTPSSSSSADSTNSDESFSSELTDDATSPASPSPPVAPASRADPRRPAGTTPYEMSSLMAQLPFKRGLSRHFQGKSQSFASLSNVRCLEDLVKPERPFRKKMKPCRSYGAALDSHKPRSPNGCSKAISKRPSRGALPPPGLKRAGLFVGSAGRPPVPTPPHRSSTFSTQTLLFA